jgi:hypothetical protein
LARNRDCQAANYAKPGVDSRADPPSGAPCRSYFAVHASPRIGHSAPEI